MTSQRSVERRTLRPALIAVAAVLVALQVLLSPAAASAHGGPGSDLPPASNWRTRVLDVPAPIHGLTLVAVSGGELLELTNDSPATVTVIGYENEPYLRVGPDGVFENQRSPATYLNATSSGMNAAPDHADATAEPDWRRISSAPHVSWHDHRAHWMAAAPPPAVQQDPGTEQVIIERWSVPLEVDNRRFEASGDLAWVPAPTAGPWVVSILALVTLLGVAAFRRRWRTALVSAVLVLIATSALDVIGAWAGSPSNSLEKGASLVTPVVAVGFLAAGLWLLDRRRDDALLLIFGGAAVVAVFFGWASRGYLTSSQIPSALPAPLARLTVTSALGIGIGLLLLIVIVRRADLRSLALPRGRPASVASTSPPEAHKQPQ